MKKINQLLMAALLPVASFAQDAAPVATQPANTSLDITWWLIIGTMIILLVAVLLLGNVLIKLTQIVADKGKLFSIAMLLLSASAFAQDPANAANFPVAQEAVKVNSMAANMNYIMAALVLLAELTVILIMLFNIRSLLNKLSDKKEEAEKPFFVHLPKMFDNLNASVPLEREKDVLLDHNYDGIHELDNNLPPWWKYGFYFTIVWAFGYLAYYHVMGGGTQLDEYNAAMKIATEQQEIIARANKNKVDENNVLLADALGIADGKTTFETNCATCHGKLAEGGAGPNLTDNAWIHGGSLNEVFKSIKYGWSAKGMKAWQTDLSATQIRNVASYIHSLQGSNPPNAKAAEGEVFQEGGAATDSSAVAIADSTIVK